MLKRHRVASSLKEKQIATIIALQTLACQHACMVEVVVLLVTGSLPRGGGEPTLEEGVAPTSALSSS